MTILGTRTPLCRQQAACRPLEPSASRPAVGPGKLGVRTYVREGPAQRAGPLSPSDRAPSTVDGRRCRARAAEPPARGRTPARPSLRRTGIAKVREGSDQVCIVPKKSRTTLTPTVFYGSDVIATVRLTAGGTPVRPGQVTCSGSVGGATLKGAARSGSGIATCVLPPAANGESEDPARQDLVHGSREALYQGFLGEAGVIDLSQFQ